MGLTWLVAFCTSPSISAIEIDLSKTFPDSQILESVRLHFLRANPIQLQLKGLDHNVAQSQTFLAKVANLVDQIGPKGAIKLESADPSLVPHFRAQVAKSRYGADVQIHHEKPGCEGLLTNQASKFAHMLAATNKNYTGLRQHLLQQGVLLPPPYEAKWRKVWDFLESSNMDSVADGRFPLLTVAGNPASGKTYVLNHLIWYLTDGKTESWINTQAANLWQPPDQFSNQSSVDPVILYLNLTHRFHANVGQGDSYDVLKWVFQHHTGDQSLLVVLDESDKIQSPEDHMRLIHDHVIALGDKRDSFKVIFVNNDTKTPVYFKNWPHMASQRASRQTPLTTPPTFEFESVFVELR